MSSGKFFILFIILIEPTKKSKAVPIARFPAYIELMHTNSSMAFSNEFAVSVCSCYKIYDNQTIMIYKVI